MPDTATPAIKSLVSKLPPPFQWGEVLVRHSGGGFILCHAEDSDRASQLKPVALANLRTLASTNERGIFRPLRSSPDLPKGWIFLAKSDFELEAALDRVYPNSVADWFAAEMPQPPVTNFREFASRQSGMYRITQKLSDDQAAAVTRATCHRRFCLKRRLWTVPGHPADSLESKSLIPCLEPCAILLETARKAMRIEQEDKIILQISPSEAISIKSVLEQSLDRGSQTSRIADIGDDMNPRRLQLILEKYGCALQASPGSAKE